jgi:CheY-like chemotaxis protein
MANELKLSQVFVNLLTNAGQAMQGERADNEIRISTSTDESGAAVIVVEDNGRGMTEEVQRAAFEPFFTTKPVGTGTGLGLSICRDIIRDFGGEIRLESELGKGTRFTIILPASGRQISEPPSARGQQPPSSASGTVAAYRPRVLVIDDEPMLRSLVGKLLFSRFRVMSVESVRLALIELNASRDYDAVLCDLMMPGESGMDFYAVLRRLYPELVERVGFITGGALTPDTLSFLESSGRPVLSKPFDARALQGFLSDLVGWSATQEACPP